MAQKSKFQDFDINGAVKEHADVLNELTANLNQPDKFAKIFCEAAEKQKSIDKVLHDNIRTLIKSDKETRDMLKDMLREVDKEDWRYFVKKVGTPAWAIILIIVGAILQGLAKKYLG